MGRPAPPPMPPPSQRKPQLPPEPRESEPDHDATSIMNRPQIERSIRAMQQPSIARPPQPNERTATITQGGLPGRAPPNIRQTGQFGRGPVTERGGSIRDDQRSPQPTSRVAPESVGAIALPRPPVQQPIGGTGGMSRPPVSRQTAPVAPGTVRTTSPIAARKTNSIPPGQTFGSQPPRSAEPPPLDDLVPRSRSERPRHTRPPVSHRSQPPRDRPRFLDRSPEPRSPGGGLPGPDSFGRIPAPIERYDAKPGFPSPSNFPPPSNFPSPSNFPPPPGPDETMAMARGPYAGGLPPQARMQTAEYYPAQNQPPPQTRSYAPPPVDYRDQRDPGEYYPHLAASQSPMHPHHTPGPSGAYSYPPPGYLPPGSPQARTMPASALPSSMVSTYPPAIIGQDSRLPLPGSAPYPYVAPPIENPSFMGLVLFAAPLALATLAVAALALM